MPSERSAQTFLNESGWSGCCKQSLRGEWFLTGDLGILNYALTLEYLEAAFYNGATAANLTLAPQSAAFLKTVTADENAHVAFLKKALGRKAVKQPKFDFKGANTNAETFMKTAQVLENTGVHAYAGQALNIKTPAYVTAVGVAWRPCEEPSWVLPSNS